MWLVFMGLVVALLAFDLGVLHKDDHEIGVAESLKLSVMYLSLGLLFSGFIYWQMDTQATAEYLTAFVVEKTLAMDNIFLIAMIFAFFSIPREYQHRVLFWGILGVIILRGIMIGLGATIVEQYNWVLYIFAVFLILTGIKMLFMADKEHKIEENGLIRFLKRHMNVTEELHGNKFLIKKQDPSTGKLKRYATPLLLALIMIEIADLVFAVDSVPAVFTITTDPYIVYTSNIFAILGLRALYFALDAILHRFAYLKYALSVLLVFIGSKIFIAWAMGWEKFPPEWSLGITFVILGAGVVYSLRRTSSKQQT
ncbi:TerC family protein [Rhizobium lemnae]|nr:TerC family protein [Rhizobium lemnae]MCJ8507040.1 TerC family protein [Rhizobium lemnae]